jgi:F0F1-type ATP synthase delta subunit
LILGIQSVEENEVIEAEITVAPEPAERKLDKVAEILAPKTESAQVSPAPKNEPQQVPAVEVDDFFD